MIERLVHDGPLVIGAGMAGLCAALAAAPRPVLVVSPAPLLHAAASAWAQGGLAAALAADDSPIDHALDTVAAGGDLVDPDAAARLADMGPGVVDWLAGLGAPFDRDAEGRFVLGLEAAHRRARVARVGGDGAGRALLSVLANRARRGAHVTLWEDGRLRGLLQDDAGRVRGALIERRRGLVEVEASTVVLATGGGGGLFAVTTNPPDLRGEGLGLAAQAGAEILDPEFVQFHPTAIALGLDPAPLATEALRGEGARLVDGRGDFLLGPGLDADLAPRDLVARAVHAAIGAGRGAFLDARAAIGDRFPTAFPTVFAACVAGGIDPRVQPIPIAPAAHYHMGGIAAGPDGRASLDGLFAIGECAATGVHGANRLASNSLLEAAAFGRLAGAAAAEAPRQAGPVASLGPALDLPAAELARLRLAMSREAGVVRDAPGLERLVTLIDELEARSPGAPVLTAARLIAEAALARRESRGAHFRADFPDALARALHTRVSSRGDLSRAA